MNRQEAVLAMFAGYKVTHYMWSSDRYICVDNGIVYNECGESQGSLDDFDAIKGWSHDWSLWFDPLEESNAMRGTMV
jgi:hypothetical protein